MATLTIAAEQRTSSGTVTVTAVDERDPTSRIETVSVGATVTPGYGHGAGGCHC